MKRSFSPVVGVIAACVLLTGSAACGRGEDEYQLQVRRVAELEGQLRDSQAHGTELEGASATWKAATTS